MSVAAKRTTPSTPPLSPVRDERAASNVIALPFGQAQVVPTQGVPTQGDNEVIDTDLLVRIAGGEQVAFAELMQRHLSAVIATARRIVRDDAEAEDIAQEAFLRLWNNASTLEAGSYGMRPWLRRVASNLAIDWLRKTKRIDVTDDVPEQTDEPDQLRALEASETAARVECALARLPPRQRIAVCLFHFDEMSQREVAELMELTEDALESLLARGRRRLRDLLKNDWQELLVHSSNPT